MYCYKIKFFFFNFTKFYFKVCFRNQKKVSAIKRKYKSIKKVEKYKILHSLLNLNYNIVCFRNQSTKKTKKKEVQKKMYKILPLLDLNCNIVCFRNCQLRRKKLRRNYIYKVYMYKIFHLLLNLNCNIYGIVIFHVEKKIPIRQDIQKNYLIFI